MRRTSDRSPQALWPHRRRPVTRAAMGPGLRREDQRTREVASLRCVPLVVREHDLWFLYAVAPAKAGSGAAGMESAALGRLLRGFDERGAGGKRQIHASRSIYLNGRRCYDLGRPFCVGDFAWNDMAAGRLWSQITTQHGRRCSSRSAGACIPLSDPLC
jgi:hypothetical protein